MHKLFKLGVLALALACSDDSYTEQAADFASTEQPLVLVQVSGGTFWTIGYDSALNDKSRCSRNQGTTANCIFARPRSGIGIGNVSYTALLPTGGFVDNTGVSYNSNAYSELQFYTNSFTSQINGQAGMTPWTVTSAQSTSTFNIVFDTGSISGTPGAGETRWEYFVKPSVVGSCRLMSEGGSYPGSYSACDLVKITIDMTDLFAAHPASQRQSNLSQAIEYGLHLALGIAGKSTVGRRLEPGVTLFAFGLDTEEKSILRQFKAGDDSGWGNPTTPPTWPAVISFNP